MLQGNGGLDYALDFGGNFLNIFCTSLSRFFCCLSGLPLTVPVASPRQSNCFELASNMRINSVLNPRYPQLILDVNFLPGIGVVFGEVSSFVIISFYTCECAARYSNEHRNADN